MEHSISSLAIPKIVLPLGGLFLFFSLYLFPAYQSEINELIGKEFQLLDTRFSYTKADVLLTFEEIGAKGRAQYKFISGCIDMIYPIVYGLFLSLLLLMLAKKIPNRKGRLLCCIPFIAVLFDYIENASVLRMLNTYPNITDLQIMIGSTATSMKWTFIVLSLLFVIGFGVSAWKKVLAS